MDNNPTVFTAIVGRVAGWSHNDCSVALMPARKKSGSKPIVHKAITTTFTLIPVTHIEVLKGITGKRHATTRGGEKENLHLHTATQRFFAMPKPPQRVVRHLTPSVKASTTRRKKGAHICYATVHTARLCPEVS